MSQSNRIRSRRLDPRGGRSVTLRALNISALMVALSVLATGACSGDEFAAVGLGSLSISPTTLVFNAQEIGVADVQRLTITNVGQGELIVDELELVTRSDEFEFSAELPIRLAPNEERVVEVFYTAADCEPDRGNIVVHSNDRDYEDGLPVPLQPQDLTGQVLVNPNPIDFGRVPSGDIATISVDITNAGTCSLVVNDLFIGGSLDFELTQDDGSDGFVAFDTTQLPFSLQTAETHTVDVTYHPLNDGFDEATLLVASDDARDRTVEVPIVANGDQACIVVTDEDGIDFGERFIDETHPKTITITNCSQREDLLVSSIDLADHPELGGRDRFALEDVPDLSSAPLTIAPQGSQSFILNYSPIAYAEQVSDGAMLVIESNDEVKSPLEIEINGIGTDNHCPVSVARARIQGSGGPYDVQIDAIPLATVEFDGSDSFDPEDGTVASYLWEVSSRPADSVATYQPSADVANPTFFLDLAGTYVFSLRTFDAVGVESCEPATITAVVTPNEAIHIQLVWHTPGDPNETDIGAGRGSDVDLHFVHPNGIWNRSPWDCYWQNKNPNWADTASADDDPSLDIDDTDGAGPENINLNNPESVTYRIGAFYFSDHGYGPANVTVRIYLDGVERFANTFPGLQDRQFWDVARVTWPSRDIERISTLHPSGFP